MREAFEAALRENPTDLATHRAFSDWLEENGHDDEALLHREWTPERHAVAKAVLMDAADQCMYTIAELIEHARRAVADPDYEVIVDDHWNKIPTFRTGEFWEAFQAYTCIPVPPTQLKLDFVRFYCSC